MNAIHIQKVTLHEGPFDGDLDIVKTNQSIVIKPGINRWHKYSRIGTTNSFFYAGIQEFRSSSHVHNQ